MLSLTKITSDEFIDFITGVAIGVGTFIVFLILLLAVSTSGCSTCLHPPDATWHIWWAECQNEGYSFHDSYKTWVDATQHGGDLLEMPKTWC